MNEYSFCEMEPEVIVEEEVIEKVIGLDIERSVKKSPERYLIEIDGNLVCEIESEVTVKEEIIEPKERIEPEKIIEPEVIVKEEEGRNRLEYYFQD